MFMQFIIIQKLTTEEFLLVAIGDKKSFKKSILYYSTQLLDKKAYN